MNTKLFKLSPAEKGSGLWLKLAKQLAVRLETLRLQNDNNLDEAETAKIRGKISFCKEVLAWANNSDTIITS